MKPNAAPGVVELAALACEPEFAAVRDTFAEHVTASGPLERLGRVRVVVDPAVHDSARHFAACREDGLLIVLAPEAAHLGLETLLAILAHELGHAADHLYPARWLPSTDGPAEWLDDDHPALRSWRKAWPERSVDQVEQAADSIAQAVTGRRVGYCGPCMIQCFGGKPRPKGLR